MTSAPLTRTVTRIDLTCLSCGRTPGAIHDGALSVDRPEQSAAVARRRCPWCSGRLMLGEAVELTVMRRLTRDELSPFPQGRPPSVRPESWSVARRQRVAIHRARVAAGVVAWAKDYPCCVECGRTDSVHQGKGICNRCRYKYRRVSS